MHENKLDQAFGDVPQGADRSEWEAGLLAQIGVGEEAMRRQQEALAQMQAHSQSVVDTAMAPGMSNAGQGEVNAAVSAGSAAIMAKLLRERSWKKK